MRFILNYTKPKLFSVFKRLYIPNIFEPSKDLFGLPFDFFSPIFQQPFAPILFHSTEASLVVIEI